MARRLPRVWQAGSTSRERQRISGQDPEQRNALGSETRATSDGLEQRRGLLSERPLDGGPSRSHRGPSEEDPGAAHTVSGADDERYSVETVWSVMSAPGRMARKFAAGSSRRART